MGNNIEIAKHNAEQSFLDGVGLGPLSEKSTSESSLASEEEGSIAGRRARSSNRLHYEAQVQVIKRQLGDLEKIRGNLGLSQRKICQLLMVDPSAWTRWTKKSEAVPPHIYRALQWYMILQEKLPGLTPQYFVGKDPEVLHQTALQRIQSETEKREEFEEAFSIQTLKLERKIEDLLSRNQSLLNAKSQLEDEVSNLKAESRWTRRVLLILTVVLALSLGVSIYFR